MKNIPANILQDHIKSTIRVYDFLEGEVKEYQDNRDTYKEMFKVQNNEFWVKYMITLREAIYIKYNENLPIQEFDYIFIDLLKRLMNKNKQSVLEFIDHIIMLFGCFEYIPNHQPFIQQLKLEEQETVRKVAKATFTFPFKAKPHFLEDNKKEHFEYIYLVHMYCALSFINLLNLWESCDENEKKAIWKPPIRWRSSAIKFASQFDAFLRSRWGDELMKLLDVPKENIGWWRAPSDRNSGTVCFCNAQEYCSEEEDATNLDCWLPRNHPRQEPYHKDNRKLNFYRKLEESGTHIYKWDLYDISMGPIVAPVYHEIDIIKLMPSYDDKRHMGIAPWYVSWNIAFGYQLFLNHLQNHYELKTIQDKNDDTRKQKWVSDLKQAISTLKLTTQMEFAPKPITESMFQKYEFLTKSLILVKLPWQPVLLQQWLSVALVEIMKFETESLELRHWPIPQEIERCVCEIMAFIADAKQRILLALCLQMQQSITFPKLSDGFPKMLMETCILQVVPALKYLTKGKGQRAIQDLKAIAFSEARSNNSEIFKNSVYIPGSAYTIDIDMSRFYTKHHWHIQNWLGKHLDEPIPFQYTLDNFNLQKYITENPLITHGIPVPEPRDSGDHTSQPYTPEEEKLKKYFGTTDFKSKPTERIVQTFSLIRDYTFMTSLFPASDWEVFMAKALTDVARAIDFTDDNQSMPLIAQLALYSMLHDNLAAAMHGIDEKRSPLACLVRMSGELIEREQRVRAGNIIAQMLQKCPMLQPDVEKPRKVEKILKELREYQQEKKKFAVPHNSAYWLDINESWKQEINLLEECPLYSEKEFYNYIGFFQNRIGRLVVMEHRVTYDIWEHGGNIFPLSYEVQYMLPQYAALVLYLPYELNGKVKEKKVFRYIKFLHKLIRFYEEKFFEWMKDKEANRNSSLPIYVFDSIKRVDSLIIQKLHIFPGILEIMNAFVGLGTGYEGAPGFQELLDSLKDWPAAKITERRCLQVESMAIMAWELMSFNHSVFLLKFLKELWPLPPPKSDFGNSLLEKAYFVSSVIQKLNIMLAVQAGYFPFIVFIDEFQKYVHNDYEYLIDSMRLDIISKVAQSAGLIDKERNLSEESLNNKMEEYLTSMTSMYTSMCIIRDRMDEAKLHCPEFPIPDCLAVKNAVALYASNKISTLNKILDLQSYINKPPIIVKKKTKKKVVTENEVSGQSSLRKCRKCNKIQSKRKQFIICESCESCDYPDVNYYCSDKCRDEWWAEEHMAEHLEFDLGLSDLCKKLVGK